MLPSPTPLAFVLPLPLFCAPTRLGFLLLPFGVFWSRCRLLAAVVVAGALDDAGGDFGELEVGGFEDEVGAFAVAGVALFEHESDGLLGILRLQKGPFFIAGGAFENGFGLGDEPDHEAEFAEELTVFLAQDKTAAGGDDAFVTLVLFQ